MVFEIEGMVGDNTKCVYGFHTFETDIVLTDFCMYTREKGKRKWTLAGKWSVYHSRDNTLTNVSLPDEIMYAAKNKYTSMVSVKTWKEFKGQ